MVLAYTITLLALCQSFYIILLIISLRTANTASFILTLAVSASRQLCSGVCTHIPTEAFIMALLCGLRTSNNLAKEFFFFLETSSV